MISTSPTQTLLEDPPSATARRGPSRCPPPSVYVSRAALLLCGAMGMLRSAAVFPTARAFAPAKTAVTRIPRTPKRASRLNMNSDDETEADRPHVVILGGGFGGINTALTLATLPWSDGPFAVKPKITLVDKSERFVFLPLLYELCVDDASLDEVAPTFPSLLDGVNGGKGGGLVGPFASLAGSLPDLSSALRLFAGEKQTEEEGEGEVCEVSFLRAQVEGIDAYNQQVVVSKSAGGIDTINYDALVVATGAEISLDAIPGASEYALPFYKVEQALELKRRLALLDSYLEDAVSRPVNLVVVGGGYSGVELALNLVDRFGGTDHDVQVTLVHRGKQVLEYATEHNRNTGTDRLKTAGVDVMTSTSVVEVLSSEEEESVGIPALEKRQCALKLSTKPKDGAGDGEETRLPATLLLWTAGATPTSERNAGVRNSILPRDAMGRILTSPTLNVPQHPNVFAVGDCGRPKKVPYAGTAQVAIQQATVAAWNVYATLTYGSDSTRESKLLPFKYLNLGEMMTLGTDDATISTLGGRVELSGPAASWLRRWIYAVRMPTPAQGLRAAADGTARKVARGAARKGGGRRRSKPVDWK